MAEQVLKRRITKRLFRIGCVIPVLPNLVSAIYACTLIARIVDDYIDRYEKGDSMSKTENTCIHLLVSYITCCLFNVIFLVFNFFAKLTPFLRMVAILGYTQLVLFSFAAVYSPIQEIGIMINYAVSGLIILLGSVIAMLTLLDDRKKKIMLKNK